MVLKVQSVVDHQRLGRKSAALWTAAVVLCWPLCFGWMTWLEGICVFGMLKMYSLAARAGCCGC